MVNDISELLFKSANENFEFEVSEIFLEPSVSLSVVESTTPSVFSLTPKSLYSEIKKLAGIRYKYTLLPKK